MKRFKQTLCSLLAGMSILASGCSYMEQSYVRQSMQSRHSCVGTAETNRRDKFGVSLAYESAKRDYAAKCGPLTGREEIETYTQGDGATFILVHPQGE